jgi:hypothetical protein
MQRKGSFVRYTADALSKLESETDWAKVDSTTKDKVERQAEADHGPLPERWEDTVLPGVPPSSLSASAIALMTAASAGVVPPSPAERTPRRFDGDGTSLSAVFISGKVSARGIA